MYFVKGMQGLGDNIYQRPFIKALAEKEKVYLETSWPELYEDIPNVKFVKSTTRLRTQAKNVSKQDESKWELAPTHTKKIAVSYGHALLRKGSIPFNMKNSFNIEPKQWDLPTGNKPSIKGKYAVIRPVTVRTEWLNSARNPNPQYMYEASKILKEQGYTVISIPIFKDVDHLLSSHHFRTDEHRWYFTEEGFINWMYDKGFELREMNRMEEELGRKDIGTYVFERTKDVER